MIKTILTLTLAGMMLGATKPAEFTLDFKTPVDESLQKKLTEIDKSVRDKLGMSTEHSAVGIVDLTGTPRVALLNPDRETYGASVPKIGILLGYFALKPASETEKLDPTVRHELGEMIKISSNEMASKYSHELGLKNIQAVLDREGFYDKDHGGGIWVGKHYGKDTERYVSPVGGNSHAVTVRQVLRFYLKLEQGTLLSPAASKTMREIFESPDIKHIDDKFVKGLKGRDVQIIRKAGWWEDWWHDSVVVTGGGRHYILVAVTEHKRGDEYLEMLAPLVDDLLKSDHP